MRVFARFAASTNFKADECDDCADKVIAADDEGNVTHHFRSVCIGLKEIYHTFRAPAFRINHTGKKNMPFLCLAQKQTTTCTYYLFQFFSPKYDFDQFLLLSVTHTSLIFQYRTKFTSLTVTSSGSLHGSTERFGDSFRSNSYNLHTLRESGQGKRNIKHATKTNVQKTFRVSEREGGRSHPKRGRTPQQHTLAVGNLHKWFHLAAKTLRCPTVLKRSQTSQTVCSSSGLVVVLELAASRAATQTAG